MKKIFTITAVLSLIMVLSCQKQLELEPHRIYYDNYYQTQEDAVGAINAVYSLLTYVNQYNSYLWLVQDISSDDCISRTTLNDPNIHQFNTYDLESTNTYLSGIWHGSYLGISRANIVLQKVPEIEMDSALKVQIIGEAEFLRGLFYFNLVRLFGDVPLTLLPLSDDLTDEEVNMSRTSKDMVYDQIIKDLTDASQKCPLVYFQGVDKGRATKGAALSLLANVHLTIGNWEEASAAANEVMELGVYGLYPDYSSNFKDIKIIGVKLMNIRIIQCCSRNTIIGRYILNQP